MLDRSASRLYTVGRRTSCKALDKTVLTSKGLGSGNSTESEAGCGPGCRAEGSFSEGVEHPGILIRVLEGGDGGCCAIHCGWNNKSHG